MNRQINPLRFWVIGLQDNKLHKKSYEPFSSLIERDLPFFRSKFADVKEKQPLCYAPFIAMYANQYGEYAPCCISRKFKAQGPKEFWEGDDLAQIRRQMLEGIWPVGCESCKQKKINHLQNDTDVWLTAYEGAGSPPIDAPEVLYLDLRPSNLCNLKCRMCGPGSSDQWNEEVSTNKELTKWQQIVENRILSDFSYFENLNLIQVKLLGGEPTIDDRVMRFMQHLLEKKTRLPRLRFTTNGTNLNNRFKDLMSGFDDIHVAFSVDAVGKVFEYIRTNANWEKVEHNIKQVLDDGIISHCEFNTILTPYNIFGLVPLLEWYHYLYQARYDFSVSFSNSEVAHTGLQAVLSVHLSQQILEILSFIETVDDQFAEKIQDLLPLMRSIKFDETAHREFLIFNQTLDQIRKTSLIEVDPRFASYC